MPLGEQVDIGNVHVHKKVIGDIAAASLKDVPGVRLCTFGIIGTLFEIFGYKNFPGVYVTLDKMGAVTVEMRVEVEYGIHIPLISQQIQEKVQQAVGDSLDVELKEVNVSIQSVQRNLSQASSTEHSGR